MKNIPSPESKTDRNSPETKQAQESVLSTLLENLLHSIAMPKDLQYKNIEITIDDGCVLLLKADKKIQGTPIQIIFDHNTGLWRPKENNYPVVGFRLPQNAELSKQEIEKHYLKRINDPYIVVSYSGNVQILYRDQPHKNTRNTAFLSTEEILNRANKRGYTTALVSAPWLNLYLEEGKQIDSLYYPDDFRSLESVLVYIPDNHPLNQVISIHTTS